MTDAWGSRPNGRQVGPGTADRGRSGGEVITKERGGVKIGARGVGHVAGQRLALRGGAREFDIAGG